SSSWRMSFSVSGSTAVPSTRLFSAFETDVLVAAAMPTDASCLLQPANAAANPIARRILCIAYRSSPCPPGIKGEYYTGSVRPDSRSLSLGIRSIHAVTVKQGWTGRVYEDFEVGDVYRHSLGRTILATDNTWFSLLTQNTNPIHVDHAYAAKTEFARPLVNSTFTLALVTGQSVADVSQNVLANLGWDEVRLPHPVFEGDTIYSQSEVLEARESASRPTVGIVKVKTIGYNQHGTVVIEYMRTIMVYKRGCVPQRVRATVA